MIAYFIIFFIISILLLVGSYIKKYKKISFFISIIVLVFFSGFRKNVGLDYNNYLELFDSIKLNYDVPLEFGYQILINIIILIGGKYQLLVLISSVITNFFIGLFIYRNSSNPNYSLFIYISLSIFYLATFTAMRQFIAVGLFFYSLNFIISKQFWKYFALILLGTSIHITMIFLLPLYFLLGRNFKFWHYIAMTFIFLLCLKIVDIIFLRLGFSQLYFIQDEDAKISPIIFIFSAVGFFFIIIRNRFIHQNVNNIIYLNMVFILLLITLSIFVTIIPPAIILRMSSYFSISYLILIPAFFLTIKNLYFRYFSLLLGTCISIFFYIFLIVFNGKRYNLIPYDFTLTLFEHL